jgi:hypothetical protein
MTRRFAQVISVLASTFVLVSCGGSTESSRHRFSVVFTAVSDNGSPASGTKFSTGNSTLGITDVKGRVAVSLTGTEGQSVPLTVTCAVGYVSPEEAPVLRLKEVRKVNQPEPSPIHIDTVCERKSRDVVVVVRTSNTTPLPVDIAGKTAGETGSDGTAHFHVSLDREVRSLSVSLQTSNQPNLRPQNPSRVFELDGRDSVLLVDQSFSTERFTRTKRAVSTSYVTPKKRVPQRIDSARFHGF